VSIYSPTLLRERRRAAGISQEQLAVAIGRSYSSIRNYEARLVAPPTEVLAALAEVIGCTPENFFAEAAS
jgi:transcriptional regulator with XRE-family HTH domain